MPVFAWVMLLSVLGAAVLVFGACVAPTLACVLFGHLVDRRSARRRVAAGEIRYLMCRRCEEPVDLVASRW